MGVSPKQSSLLPPHAQWTLLYGTDTAHIPHNGRYLGVVQNGLPIGYGIDAVLSNQPLFFAKNPENG